MKHSAAFCTAVSTVMMVSTGRQKGAVPPLYHSNPLHSNTGFSKNRGKKPKLCVIVEKKTERELLLCRHAHVPIW